jgi:predicted transcriptional regulator
LENACAGQTSTRALPSAGWRITLYYMAVVTVRLEPELEKQLSQASRKQHRSRSDIIRDALRRQLALLRFEEMRQQLKPLAEAAGYLTDDDVFRDVS